MSGVNCNLFTTADAQIIAWIVARIETYCRVVVLADRDADLHVGPDKWTPIAQRLLHEGFRPIGNHAGSDCAENRVAEVRARSARTTSTFEVGEVVGRSAEI